MTTDRAEYFAAYEEYSKVLRTWFVAYGIGGPVLLLTNEALAKAIKTSGQGRGLAALFLIGVGLQVVLAAMNKFSMWGITAVQISRVAAGGPGCLLGYWTALSGGWDQAWPSCCPN